MTEKWVQAHILFLDHQLSNVPYLIMRIVKDSADELKSNTMRKTFHYLFEPRIDGKSGFEILLRIEAQDEKHLDDIEKLVTNRVTTYDNLIDDKKIDKGPYDEIKDYGQDGWELVKRFLEIGSEIAIGLLSKAFRKGEKFNSNKLVHCFLNQQYENEAEFHASNLVGRVIISLGKQSATPEVKKEAERQLAEAICRYGEGTVKMQ